MGFLCLIAQYITQQLYITAYYACFFELQVLLYVLYKPFDKEHYFQTQLYI